MPRPSNVTAEDLDRWDRLFADYRPADIPDFSLRMPGIKERVWYPTKWLEGQLEGLSCPQNVRGRISFAAGQRIFLASDSWDVVQLVLANYREGDADEPGPELMERLFRDHEWP